jgi:uncharacterized protein DUF4276
MGQGRNRRQPLVKIRLYVEGGGDSRFSWRRIRDGFRLFLNPKNELPLEIIPCGSRAETFKDFQTGLKEHPDAFNLLLVDSDSRVSLPGWGHLRQQQPRWKFPRLSDERCHYMAQAVEAWLLADPEALAAYFGKGFRKNALPDHKDIEAVPKDDLEPSLNRAVARTQKGRYGYAKIRHCADLLALLNQDRVRQRARHCDLLFTTLEARIRE